MRPSMLIIALLGALLLPASAAHAVTCTASGVLSVQPWLAYYCDTSVAGNDCSGWTETNLHNATRPMRFMQVRIVRESDGWIMGWGTTSASGAYSISWEQGFPCSGMQFRVSWLYRRLEPALFGAPTRFRMVGASGTTTHAGQTPIQTFGSGSCGSSSCTVSHTFGRTTLWTNRMANVYYQADSAITQMATWSTNLSSQFAATGEATDGTGPLRIVFHSGAANTANFDPPTWLVNYGWERYRRGTLRHELGHAAHSAMHRRKQRWDCYSYQFNGDTTAGGTHGQRSCEYASAASLEGIATFFGVRSIVTSSATGNNAWHCFCDHDGSSGDQNICSRTRVATGMPADGMRNCVGAIPAAGFIGIGDSFASSPSNCARLRSDAFCSCPDTNPADGACDGSWYQSNGHRNEDQIARFLWDVLDNNNDSGGSDGQSMTIGQLVAAFEGMTCIDKCNGDPSPPNDCGAPGTCNEFNAGVLQLCNPTNGGVLSPPSPMSSTRDAYNSYDLAWMIPGDQASLRTLNCVQTAD